ncbi:hypothetical protein BD408DRAFT_416139 [Parasitella parasitica]|nr:hypothetical protein BD408DRAFT_416139 [Parasitella parasitica]
MANFPHWINKKSSTVTTTTASTLSPRQVANKAYSLAIKKLDRDDNRRRPHYTVRERLLLSHTMTKAEDLLNKRTARSNRRVLASEFDDDVITCPSTTSIPPPPPIQTPQQPEKIVTKTSASTSSASSQPLECTAAMPSAEHMAVSIAVVAAVAYNSLVVATVNENQQSSASFCRSMMIPSHPMAPFKTIV